MLTCFFCSFFETKYCVFILHQFSNNSRCHWVVCVSALMGKGKENGKLEGRGKVFLPSNSPECLEWLYSLHQIAVCIYEIYFLFKSVYFWGKTFLFFFVFLGVGFLRWWSILPLVIWPYRRDRTGRSRAMCWAVCFFFCLLLFIDKFIVLSFGMGLET